MFLRRDREFSSAISQNHAFLNGYIDKAFQQPEYEKYRKIRNLCKREAAQ